MWSPGSSVIAGASGSRVAARRRAGVVAGSMRAGLREGVGEGGAAGVAGLAQRPGLLAADAEPGGGALRAGGRRAAAPRGCGRLPRIRPAPSQASTQTQRISGFTSQKPPARHAAAGAVAQLLRAVHRAGHAGRGEHALAAHPAVEQQALGSALDEGDRALDAVVADPREQRVERAPSRARAAGRAIRSRVRGGPRRVGVGTLPLPLPAMRGHAAVYAAAPVTVSKNSRDRGAQHGFAGRCSPFSELRRGQSTWCCPMVSSARATPTGSRRGSAARSTIHPSSRTRCARPIRRSSPSGRSGRQPDA